LAKLHARLGATMIYVTHDQVEAMTMGDRICVMKDGAIMQVAEPLTLYNEPANLFVAGFIGSPPMNLFAGIVRWEEGRLWFVEANPTGTQLRMALPEKLARRVAGRLDLPVTFGLRPEQIQDRAIAREEADPARTAECEVEVVEPMGAETYLHLSTGLTTFIARIPPTSRYQPGDRIEVTFDVERAHLFDQATGDVLR
jgi:multiple sugar transport system ATP-binding protein